MLKQSVICKAKELAAKLVKAWENTTIKPQSIKLKPIKNGLETIGWKVERTAHNYTILAQNLEQQLQQFTEEITDALFHAVHATLHIHSCHCHHVAG